MTAMTTQRLKYFNGQFLKQEDFIDEQAYHLAMRRRHNTGVHTVGVVNGLEVVALRDVTGGIQVSVGWAVDHAGRETILAEAVDHTITNDGSYYVTCEYVEEPSDPQTESETGIPGDRRFTESARIDVVARGSTPPANKLILAEITKSGDTLAVIDKRKFSGLDVPGDVAAHGNLTVHGNLDVKGLTKLIQADQMEGNVLLGNEDTDTVTVAGRILTSHTSTKLQIGSPVNVAGTLDVSGAAQFVGNVTVGGALQGANIVGTVQIADNAVTAAKLQSDAATDTSRAVTTNHIRDLAVTEAKLAGNAVTAAKLQSDAATDTSRAVTTNHIRDLAVTEAKLAGNAVTAAKLQSDATTDANRAVTSSHIRDLAVTEAKLANNAVTAAKLRADATTDANRAVTTNHVRDLAVTEAKLAGNAVTAAKLQSDAATDTSRAVTTNHIRDLAVTEAKLAGNAVTAAKLQSDAATDTSRAVTTNHIRNLAVTSDKIADGAVTNLKLANNSVDAAKIVDGAVGTAELANGAVTDVKLADNALSAAKIADGSIATAKLDANTQVRLLAGFVSFNGSGQILSSFGVTSVTRTAVGQYSIKWDATFTSAPYVAQSLGNSFVLLTGTSANTCTLEVRDRATGALVDNTVHVLAALGTQLIKIPTGTIGTIGTIDTLGTPISTVIR